MIYFKDRNKPDYFPAFTGIRAIAALLVFGHHFFGHWVRGTGVLADFMREGYVGVTIFFTLSGYLITHSYFEAIVSKKMSTKEYIARRFARIYPLYFMVLISYYILSWEHVQDSGQVLANLTLTQGIFKQYLFTGLHPAWSLTIEVCFYVLAPIIFLHLQETNAPLRKSFMEKVVGNSW